MSGTGISSYRRILKSTTVFGGAQVAAMLINIVRGKLVAMILGPAGMGLSSLLTNAANCIQQFASLGIPMAGVREVSQADAENRAALLRVARVVRTMMFACALLGLAATVASSPLTAWLTVGEPGYQVHFMLLGLVVFFSLLGNGENTLLQGTRQYKGLATSTVVMPLCGLLLGVPLYMAWGTDGIVPAMVLQAATYYAAVRFLADRKGLRTNRLPRVSLRRTWQAGREIILLGMVMMASTLLGTLSTYALSAFISHAGSMDDVGFYQAANSITLQCSGLVFAAMATDYYPRLAAIVGRDTATAHRLVNEQLEIVLLVIVPVAMLIILFVPLLIALLLTPEFQVIRRMMRFMGFAVILRAVCFPMDYLSFSKGDKKFFFWVEGVFSNAKTLLVFILFYHYQGLEGLGHAALCSSSIDVLASILLNRLRYGFRLAGATLSLWLRLQLVAAACLAASFIAHPPTAYALMGLTTLAACLYSYREVDRRIGIKALITARLNRNKEHGEPTP